MVNALLSCGNAGVFQQVNRAFARLCIADRQMRLNGFRELLADAVQRVERGERVLKNRANLAATDVAQLVVVQVVNALAFQQHLTAGNAARRLQQANDGRACQRLACAGLAHHTEDFTGGDVERNVVDGAQCAASVGEFDDQVFDLKECHGAIRRRAAPRRISPLGWQRSTRSDERGGII